MLYWVTLRYPIAPDKMPDRNNLRDKGILFTPGFTGFSAWQAASVTPQQNKLLTSRCLGAIHTEGQRHKEQPRDLPPPNPSLPGFAFQ